MSDSPPQGYAWSAWRRLRDRVPKPLLAAIAVPVARLVPGGLGLGTLVRLAGGFEAAGEHARALRCWRAVHRMAPADARVLMSRLRCAVAAGERAELERLVANPGNGRGTSPRQLAWFAGQLAAGGYWREAIGMVRRLEGVPNARQILVQSPSIVSGSMPTDVEGLARGLESKGDRAERLLLLARLCFTLRNPDVAVALYRIAMEHRPLHWRDRVAMLAAWVRADTPVMGVARDELADLSRRAAGDADALGMLAHVALAVGEEALAREAIVRALEGCGWIPPAAAAAVAGDCLAIVDMIASLKQRSPDLPAQVLQKGLDDAAGIPKLFLCGFGWSGSGALYDEVRALSGFCEFEGAGDDAIINEGAESEVTFIQSAGGLGRLWVAAQKSQRICWQEFWDLFSHHVVGLSPIGYDLYKSCSAARNNLRRHGVAYVRPFRALLDGYLRMLQAPRAGAFHGLLRDATESLCAMLVEHTGGEVVLFNNAIFGRNAEMLEIFRSHRAAVVYRDPRDVYVDRRKNDRNHWRTARELSTFYARGLRDYCAYRTGQRASDTALREVPFERFVKDAAYRARVRAWMLGSLQHAAGTSHFDPRVSANNIGIHAGVLARDESRHLASAMSEYREMERLATSSWGQASDASRSPAPATPSAGLPPP